MTRRVPTLFGFQDLGSRQVVAAFDGGKVTSDAEDLLLREVEQKFRFLEQFAGCFTDHRDPDLVEHTLLELVKQRVFGLCLDYEDLNDHDQLRLDPLLAVLVGKTDPLGEARLQPRDRGKPLAGKSTLNRLELTPVGADADSRYKKIVAPMSRMEELLVDVFLQQHAVAPESIIPDLDATDAPVHGHQLGHFFHGYMDSASAIGSPVEAGEAGSRGSSWCRPLAELGMVLFSFLSGVGEETGMGGSARLCSS